MILKEGSFKIKKIEETDENWLLYPKDSKNPIKIPKNRVYGKLPPVWKFPWRYHCLSIRTVFGFVAYAEMDGLILFDVPEEQYPENVKKEVARVRKIEETYAQLQKEYHDLLKKDLAKYLSSVPKVKELEDSISELPVCWRLYLKMLLPMQYQTSDSLQRLTLVYWLVTIANRLYKRHVNTDALLDISWASLDFRVRNWLTYDLNDLLVSEIENSPDHRNSKAFAFYYETRDELRRVLPSAPLRLEIYLVQTICRMLEVYADDMALLDRRRPTHLGEPSSEDSEAYYWLRKEMEFPKFSSLIVEKQFTDEEIANSHWIP